MKKIALTALLLVSLISLHAAPSIVTGTWNRGNANIIKLYSVVAGRLEEQASYNLPKGTNEFGFIFYPQKEGFYAVGSILPGAPNDKFTFYFKPGDNLSIAVNDSTYTLTGKNTPENEMLAKWQSQVQMLEWKAVYFQSQYGRENRMGSTYVDFFPLLEQVSAKAKTIHATTPNKTFNAAFEQYKEYSLLLYAGNLIATPRTAHPSTEEYSDFYRNINAEKLTATTQLLRFPFGERVLSQLVFLKSKVNGSTTPPTLEESVAIMQNDTLKGEAALSRIGTVRTFDDYQVFANTYGKYMLTDDQKQRLNQTATKLSKESKKLQTFNFSHPDTEGKTVSLTDFKGKVVVVDLWATWCGPCKKEIPFFKKIEEEYHGKDVVFVGISVDAAKDKQKWMDFVKKEELKGVQLFGTSNAEIMNFYDVKGIPRFMMFDKKGNIITADAPRPSDPALKQMIDKELAK